MRHRRCYSTLWSDRLHYSLTSFLLFQFFKMKFADPVQTVSKLDPRLIKGAAADHMYAFGLSCGVTASESKLKRHHKISGCCSHSFTLLLHDQNDCSLPQCNLHFAQTLTAACQELLTLSKQHHRLRSSSMERYSQFAFPPCIRA